MPRRPAAGGAPSSWFDARLSKLALMFTAQSFVKHLLTEGDKIVLSFAASLYDQGVYALAQNYGSLVARLALGPLEESARVLFSKMGAAIAVAEAVGSAPPPLGSPHASTPPSSSLAAKANLVE